MALFTRAAASQVLPIPILPQKEIPKAPENTAKQKVLALAKSWKEQTVTYYNTARATAVKHPYIAIAGGLSVIAAGYLLASLRTTIVPQNPTGNTSSAAPPPPPASAPVGSSTRAPTDGTGSVPKDKLTVLSSAKPTPSTVNPDLSSQEGTSFLGNLLHTFSGEASPADSESNTHEKDKGILEVKFVNNKQKESPKDDKQSTIGNLFSNFANHFSPPPPPEPKWHTFITNHEYFPTAVQITVAVVSYVAIHIMMKGVGEEYIPPRTEISIPTKLSFWTSNTYQQEFAKIAGYVQQEDVIRSIKALSNSANWDWNGKYYFTDLSRPAAGKLLVHAALKLDKLLNS